MKKKSFTLIEAAVTIGIIVMMSAAIGPSLKIPQDRAGVDGVVSEIQNGILEAQNLARGVRNDDSADISGYLFVLNISGRTEEVRAGALVEPHTYAIYALPANPNNVTIGDRVKSFKLNDMATFSVRDDDGNPLTFIKGYVHYSNMFDPSLPDNTNNRRAAMFEIVFRAGANNGLSGIGGCSTWIQANFSCRTDSTACNGLPPDRKGCYFDTESCLTDDITTPEYDPGILKYCNYNQDNPNSRNAHVSVKLGDREHTIKINKITGVMSTCISQNGNCQTQL